MRTEEERMKLIRRRTKEIQKREQRIRMRVESVICVAASIFLIGALGTFVSQSSGKQSAMIGEFSNGAASMFGGNGAQGYIFVGVLGFGLGICVTILLYRLREKMKEHDLDEF